MPWPKTFARDTSGVITIGGVSLTSLAQEFGTPLYVFDEASIVDRARRVMTAFSSRMKDARVVYGGKAYLSPAIVRLLHGEGIGLDVVSGGEIYGGLRAGIPASAMVLHGNNKAEDELRAALISGVGLIVVDNEDEIALLDRLAGEHNESVSGLGTKVPVALRLNPGVDVHTHAKISTGIVDSKFGFPLWDANATAALARMANCHSLELAGLHMHLGSQLDNFDALPLAIERQVAFAADARDQYRMTVQSYSPGGGMRIAYTEHETESDPELWAESVVDAYKEAWAKYGLPEGTLIAEPGRWLVGPAAVAVYRVGSIKPIPGVRTYVAVDGGMADNIRPSMYDAKYTATVANRLPGSVTERVRIAGRFCESGDVLIDEIELPVLEVGDLIAMPAAGAYQIPMASNYNAVPRPAVVMVKDGTSRLTRRRETFEDVFATEVFD